MIKIILKKILFFLFLCIFSCSECQEQNKLRAVNWLNRNYGHNTKLRDENLFAYALRLETGIKNKNDVLNKQVVFPIIDIGSVDFHNNCISLMQCALMYKGYYLGPISGKFDKKTASAVMQFKKDVLGNSTIVNSRVTPLFFVAIVKPGSYVRSEDGKESIRKIQQYLNRNYSKRCSIITTDGVYGARTHFTIIQALQIESNCENTNGRFDQELTDVCPTLYKGMQGRKIYLLQCALYVNGIRNSINGIYDNQTVRAVKQFQRISCLPQTGIANMATIKALLTSTGDVSRPANACDCYFRLPFSAAQALSVAGYRFVGRYLTGTIKGFRGKRVPKYVDKEEFADITKAGLRLVPIFQEKGGHEISSFCVAQGKIDAKIAIKAAYKLGLPKGSVIYFSVDCDPLKKQISEKIIPYFKGVNSCMKQSGYRVGIYGTRLTCSMVSDQGYAKFSFVNDCSSRCNGNIAQTLPKNWAFDQFYELKGKEMFKYDGGKFNLDKVIASGRDIGCINKR
ncbi:MAG: DUF1906 domain-containing protein [Alphaproteobacteria bacterium]|nr:DUF1906 domain-containing protein [Alphaproteobacteria bacterium]